MWTWLKGVFQGPGKHALEEFGVHELTTVDQLEEALARSEQAPVAIFKHSTRCPISAAAHREVARYLEEAGAAAPPFYLVKVIESRSVSDAIAARLEVPHQSPQLLLVKCKDAYQTMSHGQIKAVRIEEALQAASDSFY